MHSQHTINQFIALRAKNQSLYRIAEQLNISTGTASNWADLYKDQIDHLRTVEMEAIQERYLQTYEQELHDLVDELNRINAAVKHRDFGYCNTEFLLYRKDVVKLRLQKLAVAPAKLATPPPNPPAPSDPNPNPAPPTQN